MIRNISTLNIPKLKREDFQLDAEILKLGETIPSFTEKELSKNPKLAYLLSK